MGKDKDAERQKVIKAAETYLCDQPSGDLYDAYKELKDAQDDDYGWKLADNYVVVWQPLTHRTVDEIVDLIEAGIQNAENDEHPAFMQNMDWELLKQQKRTLLEEIDAMEKKNASYYESVINDFTGILNLLDSIQDYAVDIMGIDENVVMDLTPDEDEN